jgi:hypothetical protein
MSMIFTLCGRKLYSYCTCKGKYIITCVGNILIIFNIMVNYDDVILKISYHAMTIYVNCISY